MSAQILNPPSTGVANATLGTDAEIQLLQKICNLLGGATKAVAVVPNDGADLPHPGRVWVGTGGSVKIDSQLTGATVTFVNVPAGTSLPVHARRVYATGTTASGMIVVY
jgi:hypothetical protein